MRGHNRPHRPDRPQTATNMRSRLATRVFMRRCGDDLGTIGDDPIVPWVLPGGGRRRPPPEQPHPITDFLSRGYARKRCLGRPRRLLWTPSTGRNGASGVVAAWPPGAGSRAAGPAGAICAAVGAGRAGWAVAGLRSAKPLDTNPPSGKLAGAMNQWSLSSMPPGVHLRAGRTSRHQVAGTREGPTAATERIAGSVPGCSFGRCSHESRSCL